MFYIGKILNSAFKSKISLFIYLNILTLIICGLFSKNFLSDIIICEIIISILVITTIRLSNVMIYSKIIKCMSMNILDLTPYYNLDYINEKSAVSELFKKEFIEAILNAKDKKIKKITMTTHKWVYENVCLNMEILKYYNVDCTFNKNTDISLEMSEFIPYSRKNSIKNLNTKRSKCKVVLNLKKEYR